MAWSCWPYNSLSTPIAPRGPAQPRRPQEEIPFFLGVVGFVLMPLPRLGHPRRCRPQRWRCPDLGHPFTRFLVAKGCPATRRITRFQWRFYEGREAPTRSRAGAQAAQPEDSNKMDRSNGLTLNSSDRRSLVIRKLQPRPRSRRWSPVSVRIEQTRIRRPLAE